MATEEALELIDRIIFETDDGTTGLRGWDKTFIQNLSAKRENQTDEDLYISPKMFNQLKRIAGKLDISTAPLDFDDDN